MPADWIQNLVYLESQVSALECQRQPTSRSASESIIEASAGPAPKVLRFAALPGTEAIAGAAASSVGHQAAVGTVSSRPGLSNKSHQLATGCCFSTKDFTEAYMQPVRI